MKKIAKKLTYVLITGFLFTTAAFSYAQEPVKTVAPDPRNTLNDGKPIVSFNIFDSESYKNIFSKNNKDEDESLAYNGRLAYNTTNTIRTTTVRYDNVDYDRNNNEQGYIIGKDGIRKVRGNIVNNGVASVGQAGVVLARDGQVNYGVLILFVLMLIVVIILARLTIRKKNRIMVMQPPQYRPAAPVYQTPVPQGYQAYPPHQQNR